MTVYSEMRPDNEILKQVENDQKIFITGCPVCANMSLCYAQPEEKPLMVKLSPKGLKAVCTEKEAQRIAHLLSTKEKTVDTWVGNFGDIMFCMLDEKAFEKFNQKCRDHDSIVLIACESGLQKLQSRMGSKKIVGSMTSKGLMMGGIDNVLKVVRIYLDKASVEIKHFTFK